MISRKQKLEAPVRQAIFRGNVLPYTEVVAKQKAAKRAAQANRGQTAVTPNPDADAELEAALAALNVSGENTTDLDDLEGDELEVEKARLASLSKRTVVAPKKVVKKPRKSVVKSPSSTDDL